jgi:hypothetical protein
VMAARVLKLGALDSVSFPQACKIFYGRRQGARSQTEPIDSRGWPMQGFATCGSDRRSVVRQPSGVGAPCISASLGGLSGDTGLWSAPVNCCW